MGICLVRRYRISWLLNFMLVWKSKRLLWRMGFRCGMVSLMPSKSQDMRIRDWRINYRLWMKEWPNWVCKMSTNTIWKNICKLWRWTEIGGVCLSEPTKPIPPIFPKKLQLKFHNTRCKTPLKITPIISKCWSPLIRLFQIILRQLKPMFIVNLGNQRRLLWVLFLSYRKCWRVIKILEFCQRKNLLIGKF